MLPPKIRDVGWANLWERGLGRERRERIKRAVTRGDALEHPVDAALAVELARRQMRPLRWQLPLNAVLLAALAPIALRDLGGPGLPWFGMLWVAVVAAVVLGTASFFRARRADQVNAPQADFDRMYALLSEHHRPGK